jgi:hypothetical protein
MIPVANRMLAGMEVCSGAQSYIASREGNPRRETRSGVVDSIDMRHGRESGSHPELHSEPPYVKLDPQVVRARFIAGRAELRLPRGGTACPR